jgi:hypothetical protein
MSGCVSMSEERELTDERLVTEKGGVTFLAVENRFRNFDPYFVAHALLKAIFTRVLINGEHSSKSQIEK